MSIPILDYIDVEHDTQFVPYTGPQYTDHDPVNKPAHYTQHPSGVECIEITQHMNFCIGNAMKYIWRADLKGNDIEDLQKAAWYLNQEIERRKAHAAR